MPLQIIDTHAHLDMSQFDYDRAEVIQRANAAGVTNMITVGVDLLSSCEAVKLAGTIPGIFSAVGFHPQEANKMKPDDLKEIGELTKNKAVVAIGEIGLDYYRSHSPREIQLKVIRSQLDLASKLNLPVIIHSRQADYDMLPLLTDWTAGLSKDMKLDPGVIHCFNGDVTSAEKFVNLGFYIAFGAYTGYPSSRLAETIRSIPSDRILVETDCPFLPPQTHRGKRNEPSFLPGTVGVLALARKESFETVSRETTVNAKRLFRLPG